MKRKPIDIFTEPSLDRLPYFIGAWLLGTVFIGLVLSSFLVNHDSQQNYLRQSNRQGRGILRTIRPGRPVARRKAS
jgi:hypothetical protein